MDQHMEAAPQNDDQREAERIIEEAKERLPGVADVLDLYARLAPYTASQSPQPVQRFMYATGGNA